MNLTKKQRSYIRQASKTKSAQVIAQEVGVRFSELQDLAKKHEISLQEVVDIPNSRLDFKRFVIKNKTKILLLIFLSLAIYWNTLDNSFVSDDRDIPVQYQHQTFLNEVFAPRAAFRVPALTHFIDSLGGLAPWRYHLSNISLHTLSTLLVFFILNKLTGQQVAFFASLIFVSHPIHTDAVAWIVARSYLLLTTFLLLSLISYIKATQEDGLKRKDYLLSLIFYLFAIDSRWLEPITFPIMLLLYNLCFGSLRKNWKTLVPFFLVIPLLPIYLKSSIQNRIAETSTGLNGGVELVNPLIPTIVATYTYLKLFFLPIDLTFYHEDLPTSFPSLLSPLLITTIFFITLIYSYRKNKTVFFFLSLFFLSIAHTFSPLRLSWTVAERYLYFGSIGLSVILSMAFILLPKGKTAKSISLTFFAVVIALYSLRTIIRNFDWKNEDTLWLATIKTSPTSSKAWNNLGDYYGRQGDAQKSFEAFVQATKLSPTYADAWHNAGNVLLQAGQTEESLPYFERSLQFNPNLIEAYNKLALIYNKKGEREKSQQLIRNALAINPRSAKTYAALAQIEIDNNRKEEARNALLKALQFDPENETLKNGLRILDRQIIN